MAYCIAHGTLLNVMHQPGWKRFWGRINTCICMTESLHCLPETITTLLISYAAAAKLLQLCPTLCDPIDGSPPGSPVPGILQARALEWIATSFSSAWKWKVKVKSLSRVWLLATPWTAAYQAPPSMNFPGKSTGVGCHCLLQYITSKSNRSFNSSQGRGLDFCLQDLPFSTLWHLSSMVWKLFCKQWSMKLLELPISFYPSFCILK